jgi:MoaA/NifB/PqqE/SkfB family radical SAM enzyme
MRTIKVPVSLTNELLGLASKISNKNLLRAVNLLEKFVSIKWHHKGIAGIKKMIEEDHPGIQATRRILQNANPQARSALLNNFILGCFLLGYHKRLEFFNKHGVAPPGTLMISPTLRCNLRCYGCYAGTHKQGQDLTYDEFNTVLADASSAGTNFIVVLGGEPFLIPWLMESIEKHPDLAFQIYTNGHLIDDEQIERLAAVGNAAVTIGVDGLKDETDDRKGPGAFDKAMMVMRKLKDAGVFVGFSTMTSRKNFDIIYSDAFIDTMIGNGAGYGWVPIAVPQGRACLETDLVPTKEQKAKIRSLMQDIRRRKPILFLDFFNDADLTEGCGAARITIHINANGDVEPCVLMPFAVDNIRQKSFTEILKSDFFKGIRDINRRYAHETQTCMWTYKPKDVLEVVEACGARATSEGTMEQLNELAKAQEK